jgi:mono/diheme cytochrome c family protein
MRSLLTLLVAVALVVGVVVAIALSGLYDVAATEPHSDTVAWLLETAVERSVERQAAGIRAPADLLADNEAFEDGFRHYRAMCEVCHAAPGVESSEIGKGLYPPAPALWDEESAALTPAQLHWIVEHGVKDTGMPAFGVTHDERELWEIVAFVDRLPSISPEQYAALGKRLHGHDEHHAP